MNVQELAGNIHWIPVAIMTIASLLLGALWHSKLLFGKIWLKENNIDRSDKIKMNIPLMFVGSAIMHFVAIAGISALVSGKGWFGGLQTGFVAAIVFTLPAMAGTYFFENRSNKLLAVDAGMYVVLYSVSGMVLGVF